MQQFANAPFGCVKPTCAHVKRSDYQVKYDVFADHSNFNKLFLFMI